MAKFLLVWACLTLGLSSPVAAQEDSTKPCEILVYSNVKDTLTMNGTTITLWDMQHCGCPLLSGGFILTATYDFEVRRVLCGGDDIYSGSHDYLLGDLDGDSVPEVFTLYSDENGSTGEAYRFRFRDSLHFDMQTVEIPQISPHCMYIDHVTWQIDEEHRFHIRGEVFSHMEGPIMHVDFVDLFIRYEPTGDSLVLELLKPAAEDPCAPESR